MKLVKSIGVTAVLSVVLVLIAAVGLASAGHDESQPLTAGPGIEVGYESHHDLSLPLRDMKPLPVVPSGEQREANENPLILSVSALERHVDPVVQTEVRPLAVPDIVNFEGIPFPGVACNCAPPDTNGDVGPNHYVQIVNTAFQIWTKGGVSIYGPASNNTLWQGFGGQCETRNDGDPIVLYDPLADRWLIAQFTVISPYHMCIAVSQTGDPTGAWYRYGFPLSATGFPDYPKFGVWPDGYYMSVNVFNNGITYAGPRPYVFDRAAMLAGLPATFQSTGAPLGAAVAPILPADLDGSTPPPPGAPNPFVGTPATGGTLPLYRFHVDWANPAASSFIGPINLAGAPYTQLCALTRSCVPQRGTTSRLDAIADRMMYRAAYRNFGNHDAIVTNLTVSVGGIAGIRWYELRQVLTSTVIFQQGTYSPNALWRWMGGAAMDGNGNIAIGFSASHQNVYPRIHFAARLASDPPGTLRGDGFLIAGTGSQVGTSSRWGDYSGMVVDPIDNCTFWLTNEYYTVTSQFNWRTRIGHFSIPGCVPTP